VFENAAEAVKKSIEGLLRLSKGSSVEVQSEKLLSAKAIFSQDFTKGTLDRFLAALEDHNTMFEKRNYCGDAETLRKTVDQTVNADTALIIDRAIVRCDNNKLLDEGVELLNLPS
jgi:hypothetical protein